MIKLDKQKLSALNNKELVKLGDKFKEEINKFNSDFIFDDTTLQLRKDFLDILDEMRKRVFEKRLKD